MLDGTIRDNILLGKENATKQELDAAVRDACLEEFIGGLDLGLIPGSANEAFCFPADKNSGLRLRVPLKTRRSLFLDEATLGVGQQVGSRGTEGY